MRDMRPDYHGVTGTGRARPTGSRGADQHARICREAQVWVTTKLCAERHPNSCSGGRVPTRRVSDVVRRSRADRRLGACLWTRRSSAPCEYRSAASACSVQVASALRWAAEEDTPPRVVSPDREEDAMALVQQSE